MKQRLFLFFALLVASLSTLAGNTITYVANAKLSLSAYTFTPGFTSHTYDADTKTGTLTFPSDVTEIGSWAFQSKTDLISIDIPNSVTEIGSGAFQSCTGLIAIDIPNSVETIGNAAFKLCDGLVSVKLSESLTSIAGALFRECYSLTSIEIPNSVTSIESQAFWGCNQMTSLTIGNSVETIEDIAFYACRKISEVTLPATLTSIDDSAFKNCTSLKTITSLNPIPPTLGLTVFSSVPSTCYLYVPVEGYMAYKEADQWKDFIKWKALPGTLALNDEIEYKIDQNVMDCTLSYTRTVKSSDWWIGVYLPFDVDVTTLEGTFAGLTDVSSDGILEWTTVETGTILAGTPFIYKPESTGEIVFTSSDGVLHKNSYVHPVTVGYYGDYTLSGTYLTKTDMQGIYILAYGDFESGGSTPQALKPYHIYLNVPVAVSQSDDIVRSRIDGVDILTEIEGLTIDTLPTDNCTYNLQGMRVNDSYKGIVIVNGTKIILK